MKKQGITPGPWEFDPENGEIAQVVETVGVGDLICQVGEDTSNGIEMFDNHIANGRAIAVLPELLEAAEAVADWIESYPSPVPAKLYKRLVLAIKKARGENE